MIESVRTLVPNLCVGLGRCQFVDFLCCDYGQDVDQEWSKRFETFLTSTSDLSKVRFLECL